MLEQVVYEALGEASMCWSERPKGVFDQVRIKRVGESLMRDIRKHVQERTDEEQRRARGA